MKGVRMEKRFERHLLRSGILIVALGIAVSGCATQQAVDRERMLAASGFHVKMADTPEKLAHVKALTQHKVVPHEKDGKTIFVYADAKSCKCIYVGDEEAYQEFSQMLEQKKMQDMDRMIAEENRDASMNWALWGPWPGW
ncbi:MAG: hypothetical protein JRJ82_15435 [Deltaproteobacteria bacterium]|nr:hypothetical protein [Deltaproteobacteria bacterium]